MTKEQIDHMVNRFLQWKLPEPFRPDNGVSFTPSTQWHAAGRASPHWPVGTNLFSAGEADEMVRFMLDGLPTEQS